MVGQQKATSGSRAGWQLAGCMRCAPSPFTSPGQMHTPFPQPALHTLPVGGTRTGAPLRFAAMAACCSRGASASRSAASAALLPSSGRNSSEAARPAHTGALVGHRCAARLYCRAAAAACCNARLAIACKDSSRARKGALSASTSTAQARAESSACCSSCGSRAAAAAAAAVAQSPSRSSFRTWAARRAGSCCWRCASAAAGRPAVHCSCIVARTASASRRAGVPAGRGREVWCVE